MNKEHCKIAKIFDCQDMDNDTKKAFFAAYKDVGRNDEYVHFYWELEDDEEDYDPEYLKQRDMVKNWLLTHGANEEDNILINHWW